MRGGFTRGILTKNEHKRTDSLTKKGERRKNRSREWGETLQKGGESL